MPGQSLICTCGAAVHIDPDGTRTACYDGAPHLDHTAYQDWARKWGFTDESVGWWIDVVDYPGSIRDQLVSPRLLWACGLIPGIDWSAFPRWSGRFITTAGQQPHHSGYPEAESEEPEPPVEPRDVPETAPKPLPEPTGTDEPVHQPSVATRFGASRTTSPGRSAADRWS